MNPAPTLAEKSTLLRQTLSSRGRLPVAYSGGIDSPFSRRPASPRQPLPSRGRLLVAYSGGIDSAFLAWTAHQVLGDQMLAVIADSASLARAHLEDALAFAR